MLLGLVRTDELYAENRLDLQKSKAASGDTNIFGVAWFDQFKDRGIDILEHRCVPESEIQKRPAGYGEE